MTDVVEAEVLETVSLYFTSGSSDKEYHARIAQSGGGYVVNVEYGRRGSSLSTGTKTKSPVDYAAALRVFQKLVSDKTSKGYTRGADGTPYLHSEKAKQVSGLLPQLLNVIDEPKAARMVDDPGWMMQEKLDGRRLILRKRGTDIEGINKLGLVVSVAATIAASAREFPGDYTLDGEVIGDMFHVFDIISLDGTDLRPKSCGDRYQALAELIGSGSPCAHIRYVECWTHAIDKSFKLSALRERGAEGVVFKRSDAPYVAGRPNSGGAQLKLKFVATVSAVVTAVNQQRSVGVSLLEGDNWRSVGNVTIPANHDVPQLGDVVEVRYLYAAPGGALFQPVYLGVRSDIDTLECVTAQLKFKTT